MPRWFQRQRALAAATRQRDGHGKIVMSPSEPAELRVLPNDDDEGRNPEQHQVRGGGDEDVIHATTTLATTTTPTGQTTTMFLDSWIPNVISDQDVGLVAMFNELWHKLEDSTTTAVQMTIGDGDSSDDNDVSMRAMFRQVGGAAATEFENGRRVLTHATMQQMKWAIQQAMEAWKKHAALLTSDGHQEKDRNIFLSDTMYEI